MRINVQTIPHKDQRYNTIGDWWFHLDDTNGDLMMEVRVSDMGRRMADCDYEFLIAMHEITEAWLCWRRGISEKAVTEFDMAFDGEGEPGDDPKAPYHIQHTQATIVEQGLAAMLGTSWAWYEVEVNRVSATWQEDK